MAFAYDAVWASAIALSQVPKAEWGADDTTTPTPGSTKLVTALRRLVFTGSTGLITFESETGDRGLRGIYVRLDNYPGYVSGAGALPENRASYQTCGAYEEEAGVQLLPGKVPLWPGGIRSATAPADGMDAPVVQNVIKVETKVVQNVTKVETTTTIWSVPVVLSSVLGVVLVMEVGYLVFWFHMAQEPLLDEEERVLAAQTQMLREVLEITGHDGSLVSDERKPWLSSRHFIIIPKLQLEAAVRLSLLKDFDVDKIDALSVILADADYRRDIDSTQPCMGPEPKQATKLRELLKAQAVAMLKSISVVDLKRFEAWLFVM